MHARKAAAGTVFLMALSLSFGVLAASNCLSVIHTITVTANVSQPPQRVGCFFNFDSVWTIGSDLCNPSGFVSYESCSSGTTECSVNSSDFLKRGPTYVCCAPNECTEFIKLPTTTTTDASTPTTTESDIPIATTISPTTTDQAATTLTPTTTDTGTAATTNPTTTYLGPATTTPSPMATDGTQPTSEVSTPTVAGSPRLSDSERNGYVAGLALACALVIILGLLSAGLIGYIVKQKWQKKSTDSSNNYGFGYGTSPGTTPTDGRPDYSRGISAASTTSTQPLIRNDYERNHPLTLAMSGALPDCNNNGHAPTTNNDNLNTPTPTAQSRLLPSTPDGVPAPSSSNHTTMMATISEERVEPANLMPVYEHLPDGAPLELEGQQTDSSVINVQ